MRTIQLPDSERPVVSYAVVLTSDGERAARCLEAVAQEDVEAEVYLVLNDPDEGVRRLVEERVEGARVLRPDVDLSIVFGWDAVIEAARAPRVLLLHEDACPEPGAVARLMRTMDETPRAAAVGALTLLGDGSVQAAGALIWSDAATTRLTEPVHGDRPYAVDYSASACLLVDRDAVRAAGGFDAGFFPAVYVDADLCTTLWRRGGRVLCDPRARATHDVGAMVRGDRGALRGQRMRSFLLARNRQRFAGKWSTVLAEHAARRDRLDATRPGADEIAAALDRIRTREHTASSAPPRPALEPIDAGDREGQARRLRAQLEEEFLRELVDREAALERELERVHHEYAALRREHDLQRERGDRAEAALRRQDLTTTRD